MPLTPPVPEDPALVGGGGGCGVHRSKNRVTVRIVRAFLLAGVCVAMPCFSRAQIIRAPINCALRSAASRINQHIIQLVTHTHTRRIARTQLYAPSPTVAELVRPTVHCEAAASAAAAQEFKSSQRQRRGRLAFVAYVRPYERPCVSVRAHQRASIGDRLQPSPRCPLMLGRARISRRQIYSH